MIRGRFTLAASCFEAQTVRLNIRRAYVPKVFEYAGPHKKGLYAATAIVLVSVLLGVFPLCWHIR